MRRHPQHDIELECLGDVMGRCNVPEVGWIERPPENADSASVRGYVSRPTHPCGPHPPHRNPDTG